MMSIDVEDWYHCLDENPLHWHTYEDRVVPAVRRVLRVFADRGTCATFFVLGYVAEKHPELIREIHCAGHEIASHGYAHRFVYGQSPAEFKEDVTRSLVLLSAIIDKPVVGYRAPYFSITRKSLWAFAVLRELGLSYDSSTFPVLNHRYGIPGGRRLPYRTESGLLEVPLSTYPAGGLTIPCCGGVYFRLIPYEFVRRMIRSLNRRGEPVIFYLHPWEMDAGQPRIPLPAGLRLRHYWQLEKTEGALRKLLHEFPFTSIKKGLRI